MFEKWLPIYEMNPTQEFLVGLIVFLVFTLVLVLNYEKNHKFEINPYGKQTRCFGTITRLLKKTKKYSVDDFEKMESFFRGSNPIQIDTNNIEELESQKKLFKLIYLIYQESELLEMDPKPFLEKFEWIFKRSSDIEKSEFEN